MNYSDLLTRIEDALEENNMADYEYALEDWDEMMETLRETSPQKAAHAEKALENLLGYDPWHTMLEHMYSGA